MFLTHSHYLRSLSLNAASHSTTFTLKRHRTGWQLCKYEASVCHGDEDLAVGQHRTGLPKADLTTQEELWFGGRGHFRMQVETEGACLWNASLCQHLAAQAQGSAFFLKPLNSSSEFSTAQAAGLQSEPPACTDRGHVYLLLWNLPTISPSNSKRWTQSGGLKMHTMGP